MSEPTPSLSARLLAGAVRGYQLVVSPWFAPTCRYYPSCSTYALGALRAHGAFRGSALAAWRLLRCNPWSRGGVDHVPPRGRWRDPEVDARPHGAPDHPHAVDHPHGPDHPEPRSVATGRTLGSRTSRRAQA